MLLGLRLLDANTDLNEARALSYASDIIDVYSNSWGPIDSGDVVSGPEMLTRMALRNGAIEVSSKVKYKWIRKSIKDQLLLLHCFYNYNGNAEIGIIKFKYAHWYSSHAQHNYSLLCNVT